MANRSTDGLPLTVGIDLGDKRSHYCFLDAQGEIVDEGVVPSTEAGFSHRFRSLEPCRMALEVGTRSAWLYELLQGFGHEVYVANPRQLKLISQSDRKDDRTDAETLARVARMDPKLLRPIQHRGPEARRHLAVVRSRPAEVAALAGGPRDPRLRQGPRVQSSVEDPPDRLGPLGGAEVEGPPTGLVDGVGPVLLDEFRELAELRPEDRPPLPELVEVLRCMRPRALAHVAPTWQPGFPGCDLARFATRGHGSH